MVVVRVELQSVSSTTIDTMGRNDLGRQDVVNELLTLIIRRRRVGNESFTQKVARGLQKETPQGDSLLWLLSPRQLVRPGHCPPARLLKLVGKTDGVPQRSRSHTLSSSQKIWLAISSVNSHQPVNSVATAVNSQRGTRLKFYVQAIT